MLEHDINDAFDFGANFDPPRVDTPAPVVIAPSSSAFSTPICVVYSSDVNLPPAHAPGIVMTAGHGGGVSGGGTTTTNGSTLVTNGTSTGLSINVVWDSSVSSAPSGFTAGVLQAAQYFVDHFTDHIALNINVGFGGVGGYALNGALGMSFPTFSLVAIRRSKMRWRLIKQVRLTFQRWPRFSAIRPAAEIATAESKAMGLDELKGLEKMLEGMVKTYHSNRAFGFIRPDCGGADVFFHLNSFPPGVTPEAGARVSYNLAPDQRSGKLQAVSVKVLAVGRSAVLAQFVRSRLPR